MGAPVPHSVVGAPVQRLCRPGGGPGFSPGRFRIRATITVHVNGLAARLAAFLDGRRVPEGEAGRGMGVHPNSLRYAAPTGTVLIRWDGAR